MQNFYLNRSVQSLSENINSLKVEISETLFRETIQLNNDIIKYLTTNTSDIQLISLGKKMIVIEYRNYSKTLPGIFAKILFSTRFRHSWITYGEFLEDKGIELNPKAGKYYTTIINKLEENKKKLIESAK